VKNLRNSIIQLRKSLQRICDYTRTWISRQNMVLCKLSTNENLSSFSSG